MRKLLIALAPVAALMAAQAAVQAQDTTTPGTAGDVMTGAIVGGPAAADGAVVGGIVTTTIDYVPPGVRAYVVAQAVPSVKVEREIAVGQLLPTEVTTYPVEVDPTYAYTVVNDRHVIIDPRTRAVIGFVE